MYCKCGCRYESVEMKELGDEYHLIRSKIGQKLTKTEFIEVKKFGRGSHE